MDKDLLFKARVQEQDIEIPGVGTVRVRGLSRSESLAIRDKSMPMDEMERRMISIAMVDPVLTTGEVRLWQDACSAGELEPVTRVIAELSGMMIDGGKEAYKSIRDESGT